MKILLAPDKFKDALSADDVCTVMAAGVAQVLPDAEIITCPLADGGEGTGPLLARVLGAREQVSVVLDALGRQCAARWWRVPNRDTAIVEMAEASGLWRLSPRERCALRTTSYGTGQLLRAAIDSGARDILLGVGGSATVDGGAGCLQALGWRLLDAGGREICTPARGETLPRVAAIEPPRVPTAVEIEILCDVDNPLVGCRGAAPVFGPQKGASPAEVAQLAAGLTIWADALEACSPRRLRDYPGAGAAGGLPAALGAALGARLMPGFDHVADLVNLATRLHGCDLCLTGEGRLDEQTAGGKVVAGVVREAGKADVPVVAFVGAVPDRAGDNLQQLAASLGMRAIVVISPESAPLQQALAETAENLRQAVVAFLAR